MYRDLHFRLKPLPTTLAMGNPHFLFGFELLHEAFSHLFLSRFFSQKVSFVRAFSLVDFSLRRGSVPSRPFREMIVFFPWIPPRSFYLKGRGFRLIKSPYFAWLSPIWSGCTSFFFFMSFQDGPPSYFVCVTFLQHTFFFACASRRFLLQSVSLFDQTPFQESRKCFFLKCKAVRLGNFSFFPSNTFFFWLLIFVGSFYPRVGTDQI